MIIHVAPRYAFPNLAAHALPAYREHTYLVAFEARELWTDAAGRRETVIVDLWGSYLEDAARGSGDRGTDGG